MKNRETRKLIKQGLEKTKKYYEEGLKNWWAPEDAQRIRIIQLILWEILETLDAIERKL